VSFNATRNPFDYAPAKNVAARGVFHCDDGNDITCIIKQTSNDELAIKWQTPKKRPSNQAKPS